MFCARCDEPIRQGEEYRTESHDRPTGPPTTVYVHEKRCVPAPQQTYPARRFGA